MKRFVYILLPWLCTLWGNGLANAQTWLTVDGSSKGEPVSKRVLKSDSSGYKVKINIHGLYDTPIFNRYGEFHSLSLGLPSSLLHIGEPSLPTLIQTIAIPFSATCSASIIEMTWTDLEIGKIYPAQNPLYEDREMIPFTITDSAYRHEYCPPLLSKGKEKEWRSIKNVSFSICPFKYDPMGNRLSVLSEFVLEVLFTPTAGVNLVERTLDHHFFDNKIYYSPTLVKKALSTNATSTEDQYDYLIIVADETGILDSQKLKEFRMWKGFKGFKTKAVSTSVTGKTTTAIRGYVMGELSKGVKYILLVGDVDYIPTGYVQGISNTSKWIYSDYWYGVNPNTDSNQAEVPVGRFPTNSLSEFSNMVNKTINYESRYPSSNNTLLVAHQEMASPSYSYGYQGCCNFIRYANYLESMNFITAYGASSAPNYGGDDATNADVVNYINQGVNIVNYRGHGAISYWGSNWNSSSENFTISEIDNINQDASSVFLSIACNTGNITNSNCMLKSFMRPSHGAVAFLGSSYSSETDANDKYDKFLYVQLLNNNQYHLGYASLFAHVSTMEIDGLHTYGRDNAYSYIYGGDPSLEIWTAIPQIIGNVDVSVVGNQVTVETDFNDNYNIAVVSEEGDLIDNIKPLENSCTFSKSVDNFYIVVNKHNYFPRIVYFNSTSNTISNTVFNYDAYYTGSPLTIFNDIPMDDNDEYTVVKSGNKLSVKVGSGGVTIQDFFECEKGAVFEIK